jgi:hypothetical protein
LLNHHCPAVAWDRGIGPDLLLRTHLIPASDDPPLSPKGLLNRGHAREIHDLPLGRELRVGDDMSSPIRDVEEGTRLHIHIPGPLKKRVQFDLQD